MKIPFTKMHGIGNDYIYLDCITTPELLNLDLPHLAKKISDRHFGVGSDGLVLITPSKDSDFQMRMFNSDGSESEMCGNAIRCVGKYVYDRGLTDQTSVKIETKAGEKILELITKEQEVLKITVDMGEPILEQKLIPTTLPDQVSHQLEFAGQKLNGSTVSMGNPHIVFFVPEITDQLVLGLGPKIETANLFPKRINVEFAKILDKNSIQLRVWERGAGETLACGTGACATLVAAVRNNLTTRQATIKLPGGDLEIDWAENNHVYMTGSAEFVFDGVYSY